MFMQMTLTLALKKKIQKTKSCYKEGIPPTHKIRGSLKVLLLLGSRQATFWGGGTKETDKHQELSATSCHWNGFPPLTTVYIDFFSPAHIISPPPAPEQGLEGITLGIAKKKTEMKEGKDDPPHTLTHTSLWKRFRMMHLGGKIITIMILGHHSQHCHFLSFKVMKKTPYHVLILIVASHSLHFHVC